MHHEKYFDIKKAQIPPLLSGRNTLEEPECPISTAVASHTTIFELKSATPNMRTKVHLFRVSTPLLRVVQRRRAYINNSCY